MKATKIDPIRIHNFEKIDRQDAELVGTFMLIYHGLAIPDCGAFYSRRGQLNFQLPYQADFDLSEDAHAEISKKLAAALKKPKIKRDENLFIPF